MNKKVLTSLMLAVLHFVGLQASAITCKVISAPKITEAQWRQLNNVWCASFYNAYKNLPFDQVDDDIQGSSIEALNGYLQRRFDTYRQTAIQKSHALVLAYKDEQIVGYTLYHLLDRHVRDRQTIVHIDHFAVDPQCQGQGIGKKLLEATIGAVPGIAAVVLTTRILNKPAQGFYKQQGFYELKSIDGLEFDSRYSILLRKDIQ